MYIHVCNEHIHMHTHMNTLSCMAYSTRMQAQLVCEYTSGVVCTCTRALLWHYWHVQNTLAYFELLIFNMHERAVFPEIVTSHVENTQCHMYMYMYMYVRLLIHP